MLFYILISILAGVSVIISRNINSILGIKIGILESTFFNFFTGLIVSLILFLFSFEALNITTIKLQSVPIYYYLGGLVGLLMVVLSTYITPKISAFYLTLLIFIGQLFSGIIIDYFTLNNISSGKILGGVLVLAGLAYKLLLDRNGEKLFKNQEINS